MLEALEDFAALRGVKEFKAADVADLLNKQGGTARAIIVRGHLFPAATADAPVTAKAVGKRLKAHVGEVVRHGGKTLVLKSGKDEHDHASRFWVATL